MTSGQAIVSAGATRNVVDIGIDDKQVRQLFARAPGVTFFWIRDLIGQFFGSHQREWRARRQVTFREGGMREQPLGTRFLGGSRAGKFLYRVQPDSKTPARPNLDLIRGESYTTSKAALGLETGGRFSSQRSGNLAIPIGFTKDSLGRTKSAFVGRGGVSGVRRFARNHPTVVLPSKNNPSVRVVYWKRQRNSRRGMGKNFVGPRNVRASGYDLVPAFVLVKGVLRKARLRYIDTWHELDADRRRRYGEALQHILEDAVGS